MIRMVRNRRDHDHASLDNTNSPKLHEASVGRQSVVLESMDSRFLGSV